MHHAKGPTKATIRFDPERISRLRPEEVDSLAYHVARLLTGKETAAMEWAHYGFAMVLEDDRST